MNKEQLSNNDALNALKVIKSSYDKDPVLAKQALWFFIKDVFGVSIPRVKICPDHNAPFDFVCAVFFEEYLNIIAVGNRTGGKTLDFSILDVLNSMVNEHCETATVGAIEEQAKKCYRYVTNWNERIGFLADNVINSLMSKTTYKTGSTIEVLTGTIRGVNSPHPHKAFLDEVELMAWPVLQEAFSMAQSSDTIRGQTIITSTRKYAFGPMERLLRDSDSMGFKVFRWCIMETIQKHRPEECAITRFGEEDCQGRCLDVDGFYKFEDAISKKRQLDEDVWISQWRCGRPSQAGLVYPQFNEVLNIQPCTIDSAIPLELAEDFGFAEGHADVIGFFQVRPSGRKELCDEIWVEGKTDDELILLVFMKLIALGYLPQRYSTNIKNYYTTLEELLVDLPEDGKRVLNMAVSAWYCPIEEPSKILLRQRQGFKVVTQGEPDKRRITYGIPLIRKDLSDVQLVIDPKCTGTIGEMSIYANAVRADGTISDEPKKVNDNGPDMIRYFYINRVADSYANTLTETIKGKTRDSDMLTAGLMDRRF